MFIEIAACIRLVGNIVDWSRFPAAKIGEFILADEAKLMPHASDVFVELLVELGGLWDQTLLFRHLVEETEVLLPFSGQQIAHVFEEEIVFDLRKTVESRIIHGSEQMIGLVMVRGMNDVGIEKQSISAGARKDGVE